MSYREPTTDFQYPPEPEIDMLELHRKATQFAFELINRSRTEKAALLRLACARYVVTRYEKPDAICSRLKVSRRRFFEVCQEIRRDCGLI